MTVNVARPLDVRRRCRNVRRARMSRRGARVAHEARTAGRPFRNVRRGRKATDANACPTADVRIMRLASTVNARLPARKERNVAMVVAFQLDAPSANIARQTAVVCQAVRRVCFALAIRRVPWDVMPMLTVCACRIPVAAVREVST